MARFYVDESGRFSEPDQMRLVGGLLVISEDDPDDALRAIHRNAATNIGWPVRLHAFELSRLGYVALWHASGGLEACDVPFPSNTRGQLDEVLGAHSPPRELVSEGKWTSDARRYASTSERGLRDHRRAASMRQVGRQLRSAAQHRLAIEFEAWCAPSRAAYMVTGLVDDAEPPGEKTYATALNCATSVACATVAKMGASHMIVTIADPSVGSTSRILGHVAAVPGVTVDAQIVKYDDGPHGLWLADTLLAWCRPMPGAWPTPLDDDCRASRCHVAGAASVRPHQSHDTYGKYLRATRAATSRMAK